jgi:hypothetical protein
MHLTDASIQAISSKVPRKGLPPKPLETHDEEMDQFKLKLHSSNLKDSNAIQKLTKLALKLSPSVVAVVLAETANSIYLADSKFKKHLGRVLRDDAFSLNFRTKLY